MSLNIRQNDRVASHVRTTSDRMLQEWTYSAKVLIYHYRAILKGMVPFAPDSEVSDEQLKKGAGIDEQAMAYINEVKNLIGSRCRFGVSLSLSGS